MRKLLNLIFAVILLISCFGCVWGWGHDGRGYDEHDRGRYGEHDRGVYGEHDRRGYDERDGGGHDNPKDIYDYR